jgi:hypothetical protein
VLVGAETEPAAWAAAIEVVVIGHAPGRLVV